MNLAKLQKYQSSRVKVPGEANSSDRPSSTLTEREFTKVKKLRISAQKFPCFTKTKLLKIQMKVTNNDKYS